MSNKRKIPKPVVQASQSEYRLPPMASRVVVAAIVMMHFPGTITQKDLNQENTQNG